MDAVVGDPAISRGIEKNLGHVQERIAAAAARSGRNPADITIVGVSKTVDRATIDAAYGAGLRVFGENRVQDAIAKLQPDLPADATMHLIGQLQTNKVKLAVQHFDLIESVDRPSLVASLATASLSREQMIPILLQVNVAGEAQKAGCSLDEAPSLVESILAAPFLALEGLMTIAPLVNDAEEARTVFRGLFDLREKLSEQYPQLDLPILSMGMTNDFEIAVEEGATHVRIGRALFSLATSPFRQVALRRWRRLSVNVHFAGHLFQNRLHVL